jgi:hypothetical protein
MDREVIVQAIEQFGHLNLEGVLNILRELKIDHDEGSFTRVCLQSVIDRFGERNKLTNEEFLAILVRLCMMYFVEVKHSDSLWFLLLIGLLPEELKRAKKSVVVELLEKQFIEYIEMIRSRHGDEVAKNSILFFLFEENKEFVEGFYRALDIVIKKIQMMIN